MLKKYTAIVFISAMAQACTAETELSKNIVFTVGDDAKSFFSSRYYDEPAVSSKDDIAKLMDLDWFKPFDVKTSDGNSKSLKNCNEFLAGRNDYSESVPSDYSKFHYYLMHCLAIKKVIDSKDSQKTFLPKQIVTKDSPSILPKEFIPVVAKSYQEVVDSMPPSTRWKDGIKVINTEDLGDNRIQFTQELQTQILSELARADFNGDGLEDSLVYLRTTMNGGSWESDQIITLTAGEDGVIKTLDVYPKE